MHHSIHRSFIFHWLSATVCLLLAAPFAKAQPLPSTDMERRFAELERQVAALQASNQSLLNRSDQMAAVQPDNIDTVAPQTGGWTVGGELLFLKPMASAGNVPGQKIVSDRYFNGTLDTTVENDTNPFGFEASPRIWLGYVGQDGSGIRSRYWEFDHNVDSTETYTDHFSNFSGTLTINGSVESHTFDLEVTKQFEFTSGKFTAFVGCRYGEMLQTVGEDFTTVFDTHSLSFHGVGLTSGVDSFCYLFGFNDLGWTTNLRGSLLFGSHSYLSVRQPVNAPPSDRTGVKNDGDLVGILELSTGPQWQTALPSGGYFFVRSACDAQLWLNAGTVSPVPPSSTPDSASDAFGFVGFSVAIGIVR